MLVSKKAIPLHQKQKHKQEKIMRRIQIKAAKAIKEAGYPLEIKSIEEAEKLGWQRNAFFTGMCTCALCPYAMEVWLWLWKDKKIVIDIQYHAKSNRWVYGCYYYKDQEEAIIAAIDYLVDNDLIR